MTAAKGGHPTMNPNEASPVARDLSISVADGPGASAGDPAANDPAIEDPDASDSASGQAGVAARIAEVRD
jgi:hypothetical protein